jgi:hypothetical protein
VTIARAKLVDVSMARWYHCISRCVLKSFLLGEGDDDRREWRSKVAGTHSGCESGPTEQAPDGTESRRQVPWLRSTHPA